MREEVENELERLLTLEVIEFSDWTAPIVPVLKEG